MKVQNHVLPVVTLSALASALIIPELESEKNNAVQKLNKHVEKMGGDLARFLRNDSPGIPQDVDVDGLRPLYRASTNGGEDIPYRYIVVFKEDVSEEEISFHHELVSAAHDQAVSKLKSDHSFFAASQGSRSILRKRGGDSKKLGDLIPGGIEDIFKVADKVRGYVGYFTDDVVKVIRQHPQVDFVEKDAVVSVSESATENGAPWGLARISHRERLSIGTFNKYLYDDNAGEGITAYVVDTGINIDHQDFKGRATWGKTMPSGDADYDGNGHGTHCAGTIGSETYGVAKNANLVAIKVLRSNGFGSNADVIRGVEYVTSSHKKAVADAKKGFKGSVANMSLGGPRSRALDMAVNAAVDAGVHFSVAAGNENQDACSSSPAAAGKAVTVAASNLADEKAYFSNWGRCVDVFAPGTNILSTYIGSDTATAIMSGTSMASPHVAGLLAYFLSLQPSKDSQYSTASISPADLKRKLVAYSSKDVLQNVSESTPNLLVFNGAGGDLAEFWNESYVQKSFGAQADIGEIPTDAEELRVAFRQKLGDSLEDIEKHNHFSSDVLFNEMKNVLDKLNII